MEMQKEKQLSLFGKYVSLNILGMIGLSCYILMDTFFVARGLGADGLTALNLAIPIYNFIHGLGLMMGMGGATRYSILKGRGEKEKSNQVFLNAIIFTLVIALVTVFIGIILPDQISDILGAKDNIHGMTSIYIRVILLFSPFFLLNNVLICFVRNDNNPKLAMVGMLLGSISNIILDYIFIFPMQMGMFGAVLATGISPIISMAVLSLHFTKGKSNFGFKKTKLSIMYFKDITSLGAASFIQELSSGIVMIVFNSIILYLHGNIGVAAYAVVANIALVVIAIFNGVAQGIQPLLSNSYGKGNTKELKYVFHLGLVTSVTLAIVIYGVTYFNAEWMVSLFNKEGNQTLTSMGVEGLRLYFTAFFFMGFNIIATVYFSSIDKPWKSFSISILRGFVIVIPLIFLLAFLFDMTGVWLSLAVTECIIVAFVIVFFVRDTGGKKSIKTKIDYN